MPFNIVDFYCTDYVCLLAENDNKKEWGYFYPRSSTVIVPITVITLPWGKILSLFFIMLTQLTQFSSDSNEFVVYRK